MLHSLRGSSNHNYAGKVRAKVVLMMGFTQRFSLKEESSRRAFFFHFQETIPAEFNVSFYILVFLYYIICCSLSSQFPVSLYPYFPYFVVPLYYPQLQTWLLTAESLSLVGEDGAAVAAAPGPSNLSVITRAAVGKRTTTAHKFTVSDLAMVYGVIQGLLPLDDSGKKTESRAWEDKKVTGWHVEGTDEVAAAYMAFKRHPPFPMPADLLPPSLPAGMAARHGIVQL
jgi:hypothetical protein